jgi:putative transposase
MPFALTNAPSVFMAAMNDVLQGHSFVSVYLDDILIFSQTPEEHISHVEIVLKIIKEHRFFLKLSKSDFKPALPFWVILSIVMALCRIPRNSVH